MYSNRKLTTFENIKKIEIYRKKTANYENYER